MYNLIIVEDEDNIREVLCRFIPWKSIGFKLIGSFPNGEEAICFIKEYSVDAILTDVRMPGIDGLELIKQTNHINTNIKIVILSGYDDFIYAQKAIKYGVFDYILKPVDFEQINESFSRIKLLLDKEDVSNNYLNEDIDIKKEIIDLNVIGKAKEYINEHYNEDISLELIADYVFINKSYFSRLFKKETGCNFLDYLFNLRINKAMEFLKNSNLRIYEVANMVGYPNYRNFSRAFRKITGISAVDFRENLKQDSKEQRRN